jgi:hypothetical protein
MVAMVKIDLREANIPERTVIQPFFMWFVKDMLDNDSDSIDLPSWYSGIMEVNSTPLSLNVKTRGDKALTCNGYCDLAVGQQISSEVGEIIDANLMLFHRLWIEMKSSFEAFFQDTSGAAECDQILFELYAVLQNWFSIKFEKAPDSDERCDEHSIETKPSRIEENVSLGILTDMFSLYLAHCKMTVDVVDSSSSSQKPTGKVNKVSMGITKFPKLVDSRSYITYLLFCLCDTPSMLLSKDNENEGSGALWDPLTKKLDERYKDVTKRNREPSQKDSSSDIGNIGAKRHGNNNLTRDDNHSRQVRFRPNPPPSVASLIGFLETMMNRECDEDEEEDEIVWSSEVNRELKNFFGFTH